MEPPKINRNQLIIALSVWAEDAPAGIDLLENFIKQTAVEYAQSTVIELKETILNTIEKP